MRSNLLRTGADELSYEIRGIVRKAEQLEQLGYAVTWENIGDPAQKGNTMPEWIRSIIRECMDDNNAFAYSHSKGLHATRDFLASKTNALGGTRITAEDITFFNGLGDAIAKIYQFLLPAARVIGPSPAYSTHSSAEAAHANAHPVTYTLNPDNKWYPDLDDLYNKVRYNPSIVGILVINPDNPTGMVYPREVLEKIVAIAREFDLFLIFDEIYQHITYNGAHATSLAEVIGDVPGMSLKGISKELLWPGARCGWVEYYNRKNDSEFDRLCMTLDNARMIEVSSTTLPQMALPKIMGDTRYEEFLRSMSKKIGQRSRELSSVFEGVYGIRFNHTNGAFYNTLIFEDGVLNDRQTLPVAPDVEPLVTRWVDNIRYPDQRFVYYLLASSQICVVPVSSFASELLGFRITLLENDSNRRLAIYKAVKENVEAYLRSA